MEWHSGWLLRCVHAYWIPGKIRKKYLHGVDTGSLAVSPVKLYLDTPTIREKILVVRGNGKLTLFA